MHKDQGGGWRWGSGANTDLEISKYDEGGGVGGSASGLLWMNTSLEVCVCVCVYI